MSLDSLLKVVPKIRRPIALAAFSFVILYAVYKLIFAQPIFEKMGGDKTFIIIDRIAFYVFILALVSVILSLIRPIVLAWMNKPVVDTATAKKDEIENVSEKAETQEILKLEEFILLLDEIVLEVKDMEYIGNPFATMRRKLSLAKRLTQQAKGYLFEILTKHQLPNSNKLSFFVNKTLPLFLSEADYVFPYVNEDKYTRDRERLKTYKYNVITHWDEDIKKEFMKDGELESKFNRLKADEKRRWRLIGFESSDDYQEYLTPSFSTLCKTATPIQKKLLMVIGNSEKISEQALLSQGFPKEVIVETLNPLLVSKLIDIDSSNEDGRFFTVTQVGKEMISDYLNSPK
jgi:hypothetical protein